MEPAEPLFDLESAFEVDDYLFAYRDDLATERSEAEVIRLVRMLELDHASTHNSIGDGMETRNPKPNDIDDYIAGFPAEVQAILEKVRQTIREAAPGAQEAISYQMPTFKLEGNLIHFAAHKNHIGLYPTPSGTEKFQQELAPYKAGKGSIQFPLDQPIPYDLIRRITAFRVEENLEKAQAKKVGRALRTTRNDS